jgi:FkbM family methyltransferase
MSLSSVLRYRNVLIRQERPKTGNLVCLVLKQPFQARITLREGTTDIWTFNEVLNDQVYACVVEHIRSCRTVIDLGANIGLATLYFSGMYPEAKLFSVEAEASNFSLLQENLSGLIHAKRCEAVLAAVWHEDGVVFQTLSIPERHNANQFGERGDISRSVEAISMATVLDRSGFEEVDLLKVDIEGGETELFKGDLSWLDRVKAIAIEFHGDSRSEMRFDELMRGRTIIEAGHTVLAIGG